MAHLGTDAPAPPEWVRFWLMDRFKWAPSVVDALTLPDAMRLMTIAGAEAKANKAKHGSS